MESNMTQDQAGKGVESSRSRAQSEDILKLREMRNQLSWAEARARRHLVRLGKWRRERGNPTSSDLSGRWHIVEDWKQQRHLDGGSQH